ncbi:MAG: hypothetical protein FJ027_09170 [Candidatus Rokubacteria bacterium]|nr:hypothetical protein [Candidatus Rokubacteria bacterium]
MNPRAPCNAPHRYGRACLLCSARRGGARLENYGADSEQLDQRTFDALTAKAKEKLATLDVNRLAIRDEIAAVRKLGVHTDPVRRQRLINAIEQQFNSDIAWFKEA